MPASTAFADRPGDRRVGHAGYDHLAPDLAQDRAADAETGRAVLAEQPEAFSVGKRLCSW
jgi:hypothetical protein